MDRLAYELVAEVNGRGEAEVIEGMLKSEGIDVQLIEESVSRSSYAVPLALVQVFVPRSQAGRARDLIRPFHVVVEGKK